MIYFILFFIIAILGFIEILGVKKPVNKYFLGFALIIVWAFQSLRWTTGTDWKPYFDFFTSNNNFHQFSSASQFEFGYTILNYVISKIIHQYTFFLCIYSFIYLFFVRKYIIDNSNYYIPLLLFVFSTFVFPVRQQLAIMIVFTSYKYIIERKFLLYSLLIFTAFSIHRTALIVFPTYFIVNRTYKNWQLIAFYLFGVYFGMQSFVVPIIIKAISFLSGGLNEVIESKLYTMLTDPAFAKEVNITSQLISFVNSAIWILLFMFFRKKISIYNKFYDIYLNIYILSLFISRLFMTSFPELARFAEYFSGGFSILIGLILYDLKKNNRILLYLLFVILCLSKLIEVTYKYPDLFYPYVSIFSGYNRNVY